MADGITYYGWFDPNEKVSAAAKLADAIEGFVEKFGRDPNVCLTSTRDAEALAGAQPVRVEGRGYIQRNIYYVGREP